MYVRRKANEFHVCNKCNQPILKGDFYFNNNVKFRAFRKMKVCKHCIKMKINFRNSNTLEINIIYNFGLRPT